MGRRLAGGGWLNNLSEDPKATVFELNRPAAAARVAMRDRGGGSRAPRRRAESWPPRFDRTSNLMTLATRRCKDLPLESPTPSAELGRKPATAAWPFRTSPINSWQEAEANAAKWMRAWGFTNSKVTPGGPDAGVDVRGSGAIAQVKFRTTKPGRPALQLLVGSHSRAAPEAMLFFSRSGYAKTAVEFAGAWNIALFSYDETGTPFPENKAARSLCRQAGYSPPPRPEIRQTPPPALTRPVQTSIHLTQLRNPGGSPLRNQQSAMDAVRVWITALGYQGKGRMRGGRLRAGELLALVRFEGNPVGESNLHVMIDSGQFEKRLVVSWVGFELSGSRYESRAALFSCDS